MVAFSPTTREASVQFLARGFYTPHSALVDMTTAPVFSLLTETFPKFPAILWVMTSQQSFHTGVSDTYLLCLVMP